MARADSAVAVDAFLMLPIGSFWDSRRRPGLGGLGGGLRTTGTHGGCYHPQRRLARVTQKWPLRRQANETVGLAIKALQLLSICCLKNASERFSLL